MWVDWWPSPMMDMRYQVFTCYRSLVLISGSYSFCAPHRWGECSFSHSLLLLFSIFPHLTLMKHLFFVPLKWVIFFPKKTKYSHELCELILFQFIFCIRYWLRAKAHLSRMTTNGLFTGYLIVMFNVFVVFLFFCSGDFNMKLQWQIAIADW